MKVVIDRFEGNYAVVELEDKRVCSMPVELLPKGAKEGSVIRIELDTEETDKRKERIQKLMDKLWE
ncbi:DUF3006 domain-containing protein [Acetivibrio saccincola]|jgi:hypothetical protein|uniref:DUF3006 domain-containing protein n=1 Tax=Acetivibrio saccincola TaxID=1677857 RepID=A0A2K9DZ42_9FIRM|nr:DUF3006 domain-containing protein [Acetivibrio saccincola]AUG56419.1 hypothetical protein HVS_02320 [Acetivibrio saccincola]NLW27108.1 DUF3006 domain-containing protein [Acetivibrio saccincola]PQQ66506.1 hypothetical protein B9R14_06910 [Acetivibrio saccincola]HQD28266.1 DUF3006 domain-containing protein [Acetivibrio saccincola]